MASWIWGTSQFDEEVDKATSELLPSDQEDIALNLEICDQIKSKQVQPKDAMRALKRRLNHKNPNVQLLALTLTDVCVKNGGNHFLAEISSREFMDNFVSIVKIVSLNNDVKNRMLKLIQNWATAFEGKPEFSYVNTVYKTLISEGYKFPPKDPAIANNAMTDTAIAPEWIDSDVCLRCRDSFTFTNRKHHCRNCGQVFDQKCSSKSMALPHFGIMQEVRVCDPCHFKLLRKKEAAAKEAEDAKKKAHRHQHHQHRQERRHEDVDIDLIRAIENSLKEAHAPSRSEYVPTSNAPKQWGVSEPPIVERSLEDDDEELRLAIEASLREAHAPQPSAPAADPSTTRLYESPVAQVPTYDLAPLESDAIMTFNQTIADAEAYGLRDLRGTHEMYTRANTIGPKLTRSLDDTERKESLLTEMNDKLAEAVQLYDNLLAQQYLLTTRRQNAYAQPAYPQYQTQQAQYQPQWNQQPVAATSYSVPQSPLPTEQKWAPIAQPQTVAPDTSQYQLRRTHTLSSPTPSPYVQQQVPAAPMSPSFQAQPQTQQQYQPVYGQTLPSVTLPNQYQPMTATPAAPAPSAPTMVGHTPTPTAPSLSRHNTIQSHPINAPPTAAHSTHTQYEQQRQQRASYIAPHPHQTHAPVQVSAPPPQAPVALPVLPTAPTNAPSAYSLYGPSAPAAPAAPISEPKEAMLISFD